MPKQKKTLKQKMQTDVRRQASPSLSRHSETAPISRETKTPNPVEQAPIGTFSLPTPYTKKQTKLRAIPHAHSPVSSAAINTNDYAYLRGDLLKTVIITSAIIIIETLVYFLILK
ncbi:MAG: hypothetical protein H0W89_03320 [Candidatus Levybacteria bacterium]|nr:hypothetical protein [Candidatus Levybacteria bacterium]